MYGSQSILLQKISGYHLDHENHWVAELECGHAQHVRHDPPWTTREWVTSTNGRASKIGTALNCVRCDEAGEAVAKRLIKEIKKSVREGYEDAGVSGLCGEGRIEAAIGAIDRLPLDRLLEEALKAK